MTLDPPAQLERTGRVPQRRAAMMWHEEIDQRRRLTQYPQESPPWSTQGKGRDDGIQLPQNGRLQISAAQWNGVMCFDVRDRAPGLGASQTNVSNQIFTDTAHDGHWKR